MRLFIFMGFILAGFHTEVFTQNSNLDYRLIYIQFSYDNPSPDFEKLARVIPERLTTELSNIPYITNLVTNDIQDTLFDIIHGQYQLASVYNKPTIVKLGKQVGANALLVGKITDHGGDNKFYIDAKIALLESGKFRVEESIIAAKSRFRKAVPLAKLMRKLSKKMRQDIEGKRSPKWLLYVSGAGLVSGILTGGFSFSKQRKYRDATTFSDLERAKNSRNALLASAYSSFAIAGAAVTFFFIKNSKIKRDKFVPHF